MVLVMAFGAFIGTVVALQIAKAGEYGKYLAWVGALVGGAVAYCTIDFRHLLKGIAKAYVLTRELIASAHELKKMVAAWRPHWQYWKMLGMYIAVGLSIVPIFLIPLWIMDVAIVRRHGNQDSIFPGVVFLGLSVALVGAVLAGTVTNTHENHKYKNPGLTYDEFLKLKFEMRRQELKIVNVFYLGYLILKGLLWVTKKALGFLDRALDNVINAPDMIIAAVVRTWKITSLVVAFLALLVWSFVCSAFEFIHSERRTTCFFGAALGSTVGYIAGGAIIGAVAGGAIGLIEHWVVNKLFKLHIRTVH